MTTRVGAIIQARMGSTRLPGKSLELICGKSMLQHVVQRAQASKLVEQVIIATTTSDQDDAIARFAEEQGLKYYRGSEQDVLDRMYRAAQEYSVRTVVRITADCPLLDRRVMDAVIEVYLAGHYDYVSNALRSTYPDGLDLEIFSFEALEQAWREASLPSEREHVTSYIQNSGHFRLFNVESPVNLSRFKWSVDNAADLEFVRAVYDKLRNKGDIFGLDEVVSVLETHPELTSINKQSIRDEGYYKSIASDPPIPAAVVPVTRSYALKDKALAVIPSCTQTFSKGPTQFVQGVAPVFLQRGDGSHVWDVDGNEFIEYSMGLGPVILGHNYSSVSEAVSRQMREGISFSLPHPLEVELAELLVDVIPCAEMVRFGKNGSDVTAGAVRLARAYTGRDIIACCGYHGWQDWFIGTTTRNLGVPQAVRDLTVPFEYNNIDSLERIFNERHGQVAAVIMEPMGIQEPADGFLQRVQELAHQQGALLIFDEIVTGFRLSLGGAQEYLGVIPDLACFGKAMANGYPLSALVGRGDVMELLDEVFFSFTFGGEALSLAASIATIKEMREHNVITHLWSQGRKLKDGYNVLAREFGVENSTRCQGLPPHTIITFNGNNEADSLALESLFQQECIKRGVLYYGGHNTCYSHSDQDIDHTLRVYRTVLDILAQAIQEGDFLERLEGKPVEPVFRQA